MISVVTNPANPAAMISGDSMLRGSSPRARTTIS